MKRNTKLLLIIGILLIVVLGVSFAYYTATAGIEGEGTNIGGTTERLIEVNYDAGTESLVAEGLYPGKSVSKNFTVTVNPGSSVNEATYAIKLNIAQNTFESCTNENYDEITNACKKNKAELIYTLKDKSGKTIATSNITGKTGEIELARETKTVSKKTIFEYTLEIAFVDTNADQNHNTNKTLNADIKVEFADKYNYLVKVDYDGANKGKAIFLKSDITKEEIESITTLDEIEIPEGAKSFDVSENQNKSIMMWYTDTDNNNLYEVYIGQAGGVKANANSYGLFSYLTKVTSIDLSHFDTSNVTNMNRMFNSTGLTSLDLSHFDTSKVTNMGFMFTASASLTDINISSFDTSNVTNMGGMFNSIGVTSLDLSHFDTSKVTNMGFMFTASASLTDLNLNGFDTSNVTNMSVMFSSTGVTSLDLSHFNTSNVTDMGGMFNSCFNLADLNISNFDTSNVTNMNKMFTSTKISNLDLSHFDTSNVLNMNQMFYNATYTNLDLSSFDTSKVTDTSSMFEKGTFTNIKLNKATFNSVTNYINMFNEIHSISTIYVKDIDAKTFIETRLNDAGKSATVTIANA